ncbi:MAG: Mom family adenine methylcarbamoylation protein [Nitrososphaeraceae archaeon]
MNNNELKEFLEKCKNAKKVGSLKKHPGYQVLAELTNFLPEKASITERLWHINNDVYEIPKCKMCNNNVTWRWEFKHYNTYCSSKCAHLDKNVINKTKETNIKRYGTTIPLAHPDIKAVVLNKLQEQYGVNNAFWAKGKDEHIKTLVESKNKNISKREDIEGYIEDGLTQKQIGDKLSISQPRVSNLLNRLDLSTNPSLISTTHQEILDYIINLLPNTEIKQNDRSIISPYELDIYIPSLQVAFEVNGVFWHSELSGKDRRYHLNKTRACEKLNIHLIQIWDSEWVNKPDVVKSRIAQLVKRQFKTYYARKLSVQEISSKNAISFLNANHIQGAAQSAYNFGLFNNNEMVAIMTFGKSRFNKNVEYELIRFCTKSYCTIVGGASKILQHFIRQYAPKSIISYADCRWSQGNLYKQLNFKYINHSNPNYFYFVRNGNTLNLMSRQTFQKHKLPAKLNTFDINLTEWENMSNNGYDRIWDCGNSVWILNL